MLLHGHGTTSAAWFGVVGALAEEHRVYTVDRIGDAGYSVHDGAALRSGDDLVRWLGGVLDGLGLDRAHLCGHSTGGWLAMALALAHPDRTRTLTLLDPTRCVSGFRAGYLLRALPMLLRPTVANTTAFLDRETRPVGPDPDVRDLYARAAAHFPASPIVRDRRSPADRLRGLDVPALLLFARASRCHDATAAARTARELLPRARVDLLPGLTHHSVPTERPEEISRRMLAFLARPGA